MRPALPPTDLDLVLSLTPKVWATFGAARVFVTGGTGFIGSWLLEVIAHANRVLGTKIESVVLSRDPDSARARAPALFGPEGPTLVRGDVTNFDTNLGRFDLCIHAAADFGAAANPAERRAMFDAITSGTSRVLNACESAGARHVLLTSSGAVYGPQPAELSHIPEDFAGAPDPLAPGAGYGIGKRAAEWLAAEHAQRTGARVGIARIFALLGPNMPLDGSFAAGNFVRDAIQGRPITINGDGRPLRSYLYMADACVWLLRILERADACAAYNVGAEAPVSIAALADAVVEQSGAGVPIRILGEAGGSGPPPRYVPSTRKAREQLDVAQYTPLPEALRKSIEWARTSTRS